MTHWQSPSFFAYFPANSSFPGLLGEMLSGALNMIGFSWIGSPAATELETVRRVCRTHGEQRTFALGMRICSLLPHVLRSAPEDDRAGSSASQYTQWPAADAM